MPLSSGRTMTLRPAKPMTGALCPASRPRPVKPAGAFFIGLEDVRVQAWAFIRLDPAPWPRLVRGWVNAAKIVPTPSFFNARWPERGRAVPSAASQPEPRAGPCRPFLATLSPFPFNLRPCLLLILHKPRLELLPTCRPSTSSRAAPSPPRPRGSAPRASAAGCRPSLRPSRWRRSTSSCRTGTRGQPSRCAKSWTTCAVPASRRRWWPSGLPRPSNCWTYPSSTWPMPWPGSATRPRRARPCHASPWRV